MILALDIGNTAITLGCYREDTPAFISRITTDPKKMKISTPLTFGIFWKSTTRLPRRLPVPY